MSLRHRSGKRALDRQYPVCGDRARDRFGNPSKAAHWLALGIRKHRCRSGIRM